MVEVYTVDADTLKSILERLPQDQHEDARRMIATAEVAGIEQVSFWEWLPGSKANKFDLVGFDPHGRLRFLA